jgi:hypothetical protein
MTQDRASVFIQELRRLLVSDKRTEKTIDKIVGNLYTLYFNMDNKGAIGNLDFLFEYEAVEKAMKGYTLRSYKTYIGSAVVCLFAMGHDDIGKQYRQKLNEMKETVDAEDDTNTQTEKQKQKMVDFGELCYKREKMKEDIEKMTMPISKTEYQYIQAYMLLCMVTLCDTIFRNQEFCNMAIVNEWKDTLPTDKNYFAYGMNMMYINKYKTAKTYGKLSIVLGTELSERIKDCLSMRPDCYEQLNNGRPFLINLNGESLSMHGGLQRLYKIAGFPTLTPTIVRNIVATHRTGELLPEIRRIEQNARNFGHSFKQHLRYVRF